MSEFVCPVCGGRLQVLLDPQAMWVGADGKIDLDLGWWDIACNECGRWFTDDFNIVGEGIRLEPIKRVSEEKNRQEDG